MENLLKEAATVALKSTMRKRYGCLIVLGKKIIGIGYNQKIGYSYRDVDEKRHSYHAERNAIVSLDDRRVLSRAKIILVRIDKNGYVYPAKPCPMCNKYLRKFGVEGVYTIEKIVSMDNFS